MNPRTAYRLLPALLLTACTPEHMDDCFTSTGPQRVEERSVGGFTAIRLSGRVDLELRQDTLAPPSVTVEAGRNLMEHLRTEVVDGELRVENTIRCHWVRGMKELPLVRITVPRLERFTYSGLGDVEVLGTLRMPSFRFEQHEGQGTVRMHLEADTCWFGLHTGVGDVVLGGRTHTAYLYAANFGRVDARALDARQVLLNNSGSGDIHCSARDALYAILTNAGDVYYRGDPPVVEVSETGSGRLFRE